MERRYKSLVSPLKILVGFYHFQIGVTNNPNFKLNKKWTKGNNVSYLQRKGRLLIINANKDLSHNKLVTVLTEDKLCSRVFVTFTL